MNLKTIIRGLAAIVMALLLAGARDPAAPKPSLKIDLSPLNDGKSASVVSYADVVEPEQKTVVSI